MPAPHPPHHDARADPRSEAPRPGAHPLAEASIQYGMDPASMSPFEALAVWRMGPGDPPGHPRLRRELRDKARWRAGVASKAATSAARLAGHLAESLALAVAAKLAPKRPRPGQDSLAARIEARHAKACDAGMDAIHSLFSSLDWNGWRAGELAKTAALMPADTASSRIYLAAATQALSRIRLPSHASEAQLMPALSRWIRSAEDSEGLGATDFTALLTAFEASGADAAWRPLPCLPALGTLLLTAHSTLAWQRAFDPSLPPPACFQAIKARLEAQEIDAALPARAQPAVRKPRRV